VKTFRWSTLLLVSAVVVTFVLQPMGSAFAAPAKAAAAAPAAGPVNLNTASQKDLEGLPGVGAATAKKIIAGRPYSSAADLAKAGVSAKTIEKITPLVTVSGGAAAPAPAPAAAPAKAAAAAAKSAPAAGPAGAKVDLNTASQKDLEGLPGVGAATAKKIIAGRPYTSAADLAKAGVSAKTIEKITPLVTAGAAAAAPAPAAKPAATPTPAAKSAPAAAGGKVDLNNATQKELEALPGVGAATAKKIIAGRPYTSAADLAKAGVSAKTIEKITPLVSAGAAAAAPAASPAPAAAPAPAASRAGAAETPTATAQTPPVKGMVWVNTDSKIFHREGSVWYGRTKQGKFMTEADALKAGYREAKKGGGATPH